MVRQIDTNIEDELVDRESSCQSTEIKWKEDFRENALKFID